MGMVGRIVRCSLVVVVDVIVLRLVADFGTVAKVHTYAGAFSNAFIKVATTADNA